MKTTGSGSPQVIGVVFGGASSEYEISLLSAYSILKNIDRERYEVYMIGITKAGAMYLYAGDIDRIKDNTWEGEGCVPCVISPDRLHHGFVILGDITSVIRLDCVFPVLHGKNGEDGTIQGLLEMSGVPYVGCNVLSSSCCMDKVVTKTLLDGKRITNAKWVSITRGSYNADPTVFHRKVEETIGFPCFVKPANAGSSVGITKVKTAEELDAAMELALQHDSKALVERMIKGLELECAVLGNGDPIVSPVGEIAPCNDWYDYDAKYLANKSKTYIPARIPEESSDRIRAIAKKAYKLLNCTGLARIDFFLTDDGEVVLNELNTLPGFTSISMYAKLMNAAGISYTALISELIGYAMKRGTANG